MSSARSQKYQKFRRILKEYGKLLAVISIPVIVWALILIQGDLARARHAELVNEVRTWPVTEASILSFRLMEASKEGSSDPVSSPSQAFLRVGYQVEGRKMETDYSAAWVEKEKGDWSRRYAAGKKIEVRVCPSDSRRISLWDHNGIP